MIDIYSIVSERVTRGSIALWGVEETINVNRRTKKHRDCILILEVMILECGISVRISEQETSVGRRRESVRNQRDCLSESEAFLKT